MNRIVWTSLEELIHEEEAKTTPQPPSPLQTMMNAPLRVRLTCFEETQRRHNNHDFD
jgi:hypothetical protein